MIEAIDVKRFISLCEIMRRFQPQLFVDASVVLKSIDTMLKSGTAASGFSWDMNYIKPESETVAQLKVRLSDFKANCVESGLQMTAFSVDRALACIGDSSSTWGDVNHSFKSCSEILHDELSLFLFFSIDRDKQYLVAEEPLFGGMVADAFPSAEADIQDAGRCLAMEQWVASIFHSMRVLEVGLGVLATQFSVSFANENWQKVIDLIEAEIREISQQGRLAGPNWKDEEHFYAEAALQFRYFKNAWRNYVMHIKEPYDERRAMLVFEHVKEFMQHISQKLHE